MLVAGKVLVSKLLVISSSHFIAGNFIFYMEIIVDAVIYVS